MSHLGLGKPKNDYWKASLSAKCNCLVRFLYRNKDHWALFFENEAEAAVSVNGLCYQSMINECSWPELENMDLDDVYFQQDGVTCHTTLVEIFLSFLISSWVLVRPGLEFPNTEKTGRGAVSTRLVFLGQKKLIGALLGASDEFLVSLKYEKSICIWWGPD